MESQTPRYVELQVTTNFSFLRGGSHPEELITQAAALGYKALAITDLNSLAGIVRAHVAAKKSGIALIVGARITILKALPQKPPEDPELIPSESLSLQQLPEDSPEIICSLLLYPTDKTSYGRLSKLLTLGKRRAPKGECYITLDDLEEFKAGLLATIVLSHNNSGGVVDIQQLQSIFTDDTLSLAIWNSYGPDNFKRHERLLELSQTLSLPLVATNDVYYHAPERRSLQDVLTCIRLGTTIEQAGFSLFANGERYLKPPAEMERLFRKFPAALQRTQELAERASRFSLDELKYEYPHEVCPAGESPLEYLTALTWKSAEERYPYGTPEKIKELILYELKLIAELNYAKYFLTVYDIVLFARSQGILCQGRGAAANSAVCYVLGITAVDPDRVSLLFERFISKERNEPPDIDIDFEHERREEVIQYIYNKYGRDRAALVAEVISYRTRSAVRDVGKALGLSLDTVELLVKVFTRTEDKLITPEVLTRFGLNPEDPAIKNTITLSNTIYGFPRHLSQHVGGFVISEGPLSEMVPIENAAMENRSVIEWDKDDVDAMGMLKIDVLGLGILTAIRKCLTIVNKNELLMLHSIPAEDPAVYDMLCKADSIGVFQIESRAQMSMLPRLKPRCFYDLVIEVAIVRPGPIQGGMVHPFLRRRAGEEPVSYPDERVKKVLHRTLGVPIFQEQVMELSVVAAGFSPGEADNLRRAIASWKRNKNLLATFGARIIDGMQKNGYTRAFAEQVFSQIQGFGEYGFPQSHAASFALLVYVSAWLKLHHPAAFAAAMINSQPMGFYQPAQLVEDAKRHGVLVREVDVNYSAWDCTIEGSFGALRLGMRLIKGLRQEEAEKISETVKKHGIIYNLRELWIKSGVKSSTLKVLARADAFNSLSLNRQKALWEIRNFKDERLPLFEGYETPEPEANLPALSKVEHVVFDYNFVGLSLKAHPASFLRGTLERRGVSTASEIQEPRLFRDGAPAAMAGLVLCRQRPMTSKGVVFMTLEDETGVINIIVRPDIYKRYRWVMCDSNFLAIAGRVQRRKGILHLMAQSAWDVSGEISGLESFSRDFH